MNLKEALDHVDDHRMMAATRARSKTYDDEGLSLVEVIVAITVVGIVMSAAALFFINALKSTSGQGQRNQAISVAQRYMEATSATKPSELLTGRYKATVDTFLAGPRAATLTANDVTTCPSPAGTCPLYYDATATSSSTPVLPLSQTSTVAGTAYTIRTFVDGCYLDTAGSCLSTTSSGAQTLYRVTVDVAWTRKNGGSCSNGCSYAMASLIDLHGDPVFNTNISTVDMLSIVPVNGVAVGATKTLNINGTGFRAGATVSISGAGGTFGAIATNTGNVITVPFTGGATPGPYNITVVNPDGGRDTLPYVVNPLPNITGTSPTPIPGNTPTTVTLTGTGFQSGLSIAASSGSVANATWGSATSATFTYTGLQLGGTVTFTLTNPDGGVDTQTATVRSAPSISGFVPGSSTVGFPSSVTVNGGGFQPGATASISSGGTVTVTSVAADGSSLVATITGTTVNNNATITILNPDGGTTSRNGFVVSPMTVTSISQSTFAASTTTSGITLSGTGFRSGATVTLSSGGTATVTSVAANGQSLVMNVTTGSVAASNITFTVRNTDSTQGVSGALATVYAIPTVSNSSATGANKGSTKSVTVTGTNFVANQTSIVINDSTYGVIYSGPLTVASSTSGSFTMPASSNKGTTSRTFTVTVGNVAVSNAYPVSWTVS
ncbi:MAG: hypothetical protein JWO22_1755 [Frankiales bacterium]|nr:hypothetical protein [Frankiales bacterium]